MERVTFLFQESMGLGSGAGLARMTSLLSELSSSPLRTIDAFSDLLQSSVLSKFFNLVRHPGRSLAPSFAQHLKEHVRQHGEKEYRHCWFATSPQYAHPEADSHF